MGRPSRRELLPTPAGPVGPGGELLDGLTAGALRADPLAVGPKGGRGRRWSYAAAGDAHVAVGAALVGLGAVGTVFAWIASGDRIWTWERRVFRPGALRVGATPGAGGTFRGRHLLVAISGRGDLRLAVTTRAGEHLAADLRAGDAVPAVCSTATAGGGWNVTQKVAGYGVEGSVRAGRREWRLDGAGWRDWTAGRQDRSTTWRWAAGAGEGPDGRRVGFNLSTGMNAAYEGENVVWWDGQPSGVALDTLAPEALPSGAWRLAGPGWGLRFDPATVRSATENLLVVRSSYVQPVGTFTGTLPGPDGDILEVRDVPGVTEQHTARW